MKISIIMPAYNVEKYIGRCLNSIYSQKAPEESFEVILVNDGSTDGTEAVVEKYLRNHKNIVYIKQRNQGQSVARNVAMDHAQGDLIWFVDSDDAITEDSLSKIPQYFEQYPHADFLIFDRLQCYEDDFKATTYFKISPNDAIYGKPLGRVEANRWLKTAVNWHCIYRRSYIEAHHFRLMPGNLNEDNEARLHLFFFAKEVRYIPYAHYIYTLMRTGSVTTENFEATEKNYQATLLTLANWEKFAKENVRTREDKKFYNGFVKEEYGGLLMYRAKPKDNRLYSFYKENKWKWRKAYLCSYLRSRDFSFKHLAKAFLTLVYPQIIIKHFDEREGKSLADRSHL